MRWATGFARCSRIRTSSSSAYGVAIATDILQVVLGPLGWVGTDEVLDVMPIDLRTVFVLFELEGMSTVEIAPVLGIPVGTASSRLRRAREEFQATPAWVPNPKEPRRVVIDCCGLWPPEPMRPGIEYTCKVRVAQSETDRLKRAHHTD